MPLRPVEDPDHALARGSQLALDLHLVRVQVHEAALEAQAPSTQEALADPGRAKGVGSEVPDEGHRVEPEHAARDEDGDPRRVGERGGDEEAVRDDDELLLRAQLESEVVSRGARVQRNGFPFVDHRRRGLSDGTLPLDFQPQPKVEAELGLAALERPYAAPDPCHEALPGQLGEIATHGDLGDGEDFRKFRNVDGVPRLEQAQNLLHALVLRQIHHVLGHSGPLRRVSSSLVGAGAATLRQLRLACQCLRFHLRN